MNRTVKQSLYQLGRHFGVKAVLVQVQVGDVTDDFTGVQSITETSVNIQPILLPVEQTVQERLDRGASSRYAGDLQVGDREFIVDQKHSIKIGDIIEYYGKRWTVVDLADYEGLAYYALVRNMQNESIP